ncbi:CHASE domain-containing protein [Dyella koreensis]|uniref:histidine kinase n=1 Tax=Dyella koreensis TaxID=311235 RepID=A0ABW8K5F3_9GAMM
MLRRYLLPNLLVAAAYYAAGRLGLLLAIPPGYATAVWPPSGIALACVMLWGYRVTPGVWVGSFLINAWTSLDTSSTAAILHSLSVPTLIATGAALQAATGTWLIRRFVGYRNLLIQDLDVVRILTLGGPLACIINASVGVGTLTFYRLVPLESAPFNWWTWWIGDSIGVLIFTPLVLIWAVRPRAVWLTRQITVSVPLALVFGLVVWLFFFTSNREQARMNAEFQSQGHDFSRALQEDMRKNLGALYALQAFYASVDHIDRRSFTSFAGRLLARRSGVQALEWAPLVRHADRADFEAKVRADGFPQFAITERAGGGSLVPADPQDTYVPIEYIVPFAGNKAAMGYAGTTEPSRLAAIQMAGDSGEPVATARVHLVQDAPGHHGLLVFLPCYATGMPIDTVAARRQALRGFMLAVLRIPDLMQDSLDAIETKGVLVRLLDSDAPEKDRVLYGADPAASEIKGGLEQSHTLDIAHRHWQLQLTLPAQYLTAHKSWQAWTLLAAGMLFTGLLGMFLLLIIGRTARLDELVAERTTELSALNHELAEEVRHREWLEMAAREQATKLAVSNKELEQFAYVASHDLQAPLRSVTSFATLLERRYKGRLGDDADEFLAAIRESVMDMRGLINDLLELSRVNSQSLAISVVSSQSIVERACQQLAEDIHAAHAKIDFQDLPMVRGDERTLTQLFQNLIGNGIKFQPKGASPRIDISVQRQGDEWQFAVHDNGIGISPEHQETIFLMFKRLHTAEQYPGTGIGLALCSKILQLHGSRLWVSSTPGHGATFYFSLSAVMAETRRELTSSR